MSIPFDALKDITLEPSLCQAMTTRGKPCKIVRPCHIHGTSDLHQINSGYEAFLVAKYGAATPETARHAIFTDPLYGPIVRTALIVTIVKHLSELSESDLRKLLGRVDP